MSAMLLPFFKVEAADRPDLQVQSRKLPSAVQEIIGRRLGTF